MMKKKFSRQVIIWWFIAGLIMVTACNIISSPIPPEVKISWDSRPVCPDDTVGLVTESKGTDLAYTWNLDGNGTLEHQGGDGDEGSSNRYTAPTTSSNDEIIKVTVTDPSKQSATGQIIIQVQDCTTLTPSPDVTLSPTQTSIPSATDTLAPPTLAPPTPTTLSCNPESLTQTLRILQWKHFVDDYDPWFDHFAKEWGCQNNVKVIVDHIGIYNLAFCLEAEIAEANGAIPGFDINSCFNGNRKEGEKHDLIEMVLPPHEFAKDLVDLTNFIKVTENELSLGEQTEICRQSSSLEGKYFGLCHGWAPELGHYRQSLWEKVNHPDGPKTYQNLLEGGRDIKTLSNNMIKVGLPFNPNLEDPELDINNAIRAIFWSYGAYVQDENKNVVFNSTQTIEATKYMSRLYNEAMDSSVLGWNDKSNNDCLAGIHYPETEEIRQDCSYVLNAISAYRDAQGLKTDGDIVLAKPLSAPSGEALAPPHVVQVYVMPSFLDENQRGIAQKFLKVFIKEYDRVMRESLLYTLSAWPDQLPIPTDLLQADPKLAILEQAIEQEQNWLGWTRNIGYPGPTNAAVVEVFRQNILPNMVVKVALDAQGEGDEAYEKAARDEMAQALEKICGIFEQEFGLGNVGGCQ